VAPLVVLQNLVLAFGPFKSFGALLIAPDLQLATGLVAKTA